MHKFITPRVGSDVTLIILTLITTKFQSTLPVWGATPMQIPLPVRPIDFNPRSPCGERQLPALQRGTDGHFNPRSPCGERHFNDVYSVLLDDISIHAPRVGSNRCFREALLPGWNFNPRSPCGERPIWGLSGLPEMEFQSTLPVWGATHISFGYRQGGLISIHAPRVGSDAVGKQRLRLDRNFNPRSPCGERLIDQPQYYYKKSISIHAPRVGSDRQCVLK